MKSKLIKFLAFCLVLNLCIINSVPIALAAESVNSSVLFSSDQIYGKVFTGGENEAIKNYEQLDSSISNVRIASNGDDYNLEFMHAGKTYDINYDVVDAKSNNINGDHYLFSPKSFVDDVFEIVQIAFTTNANEYDLLPVNYDFVGNVVLTIVFENKNNKDLYYWQGVMYQIAREEVVIDTVNTAEAIENANEYYYIEQPKSEENVAEIDFSKDYVSQEEYEAAKNEINGLSRIYEGTSNNPYYNLGIPNSIFHEVTDEWQWLSPNKSPITGKYYPIMYYALSYERTGVDYIYTSIMIIGHTDEMPTSSTIVMSNGKSFAKANAMIEIEVYKEPQTVIYNPETDTYHFFAGGENLTRIVEPSVKLEKNSTGVPHVLCGRYEFSNATKNNFLGIGALALRNVVVSLLDIKTYGIASVVADILDVVSNAGMSVGESNGYVPIEEYSPDIDVQIAQYGEAMCGSKSKVKGYLQEKDQYFGTRCWFATPSEYSSEVIKIKWVYYVSIEYK